MQFLGISKKLADLMTGEKLPSLGDITMESLREDRGRFDTGAVLELSDDLIDISKAANRLQYTLFQTAVKNPVEYLLPESKSEPVISGDGKFIIKKEGDVWRGFMKVTHFADGEAFEEWRVIRETPEETCFDELADIAEQMKEKERAARG
jgi:hypothetical protein